MITQGQVLDIARDALYTIITVSAPLLTFIPKIIAVFVGMILCGSWMLNQLSDFMVKLWNDFGIYIS